MISTLIALTVALGSGFGQQDDPPQQGNTIPITNNNTPPPPAPMLSAARGAKPTHFDWTVGCAIPAVMAKEAAEVRLVVTAYGPYNALGESLISWGQKDVFRVNLNQTYKKDELAYVAGSETIRVLALPDVRARMEKVRLVATFIAFDKMGRKRGMFVQQAEIQLYIPKRR